MADKQGTLQSIGTVLTTALRPLTFAFSGTEQFKGFMLRLGWSPTDLPPAYQALTSLINAAIDKLENLGDNPSASDVLDLVHKAVAAFQAVRSISTAPPGVDAGAFLSELPERLFEILLVDFIAAEAPTAYNALVGLNVIKFEHHAAAAGRPTFLRVKFDWAAIPKMISDPGSIPQQVCGWGTPDLDAQKVIDYAAAGLLALGLPVFLRESDADAVIAYSADTLERVPAWKSLDVLFYSIAIAGKNLDALFRLRPLPAFGSHLPGFVLEPVIPSEFPLTMKLADDISMRLRAGTNVSDLFGLVVQPDGVSVTYPFAPGTTPPSAGLGVGFDFKPSDPAIVLGEPRSTRLQFKGASLDLAATFGASAYEFTFGARMTDLALVLAAGESDGFIKKILGDGETTIAVPLGIEWSNISGVTFKGSGGFEVALYPHLSLGPIDITELIVRLAVPADPKPKLNLEIGATLSGDLGPLKFSVEEIGLRVYVTFEHGNAGPFDVDLGFKPPKGAGLLIDAGIVAGGGYLFIDSEHGRYAGALQLVIADFLNVSAIGLIETRLPDGSEGFSLLVIITAEFGPGIQLGFGFTLLGVGGLLGLNRSVAFQAVLDGVRTNAISSVMFPQNVIQNAPRIISDLQRFFPSQQGTFLVGPMAKLGWGQPTLISLSLGVIVEIPPGDILILGVLKLALPAEDLPILVLQVNFAGAIEFSKKRMYFYASLYDSRVLFMTLDGQMGLLFAWGDDANLVLSVGGFHPQFNPPPLPFPTPQRIQLNIINESYARIHAEGYFAVTTNTAQFGAHASYFFGFSALSVEGNSGFDALIQFSPFHFTVTIRTSFSVKVFGLGVYGVDIRLTLEGPTRWHANGTASLSFFFFSIDIGIDFSWGEDEAPSLPPVAVMPLLAAELGKQSNWRAFLPPGSNLLVSLRQLDPADTAFVLHPVGTLRVSQRLVPLDLTLDKFGNQLPSDANRFSLTVSGGGLSKFGNLQEPFAPAQFRNIDDAGKLSQPAFVPQDSGIELAVTGITYASGTAITRTVRYDTTIIDTKLLRASSRFFVLASAFFNHFLRGAAVARCELSAFRKAQTKPYSASVTVAAETFVVAVRSDNTLFRSDAAAFTSQAAANDYVARAVARDPALDGTLHVLPHFEMAA
jgi:Family of unknown function (DUF6603)